MTPRHAATVILTRPHPSGWQLLMLKRSARASFMPDRYVYPGGALDPEDCSPDTHELVHGLSAEQAQRRLGEPHLTPQQALGLYVAAMREVFEESGLLLAAPRTDPHALIDLSSSPEVTLRFSDYRAQLRAHQLSMSQMLRREGLVLTLEHVGYIARWITPLVESKRFDARFFVVNAPTHQVALPDHAEVVAHRWASPRALLDAYHAGDLLLAPPTWSTLLRLHEIGRELSQLEQMARTCRPAALLPHVRGGELGTPHAELVLPHHPDYPAELLTEHVHPVWSPQDCPDFPPWRAIRRGPTGWQAVR